MNYQIITDKDALLSFIEWLPELEHHETFYLCLFARSKYCKEVAHIKSDKAQLKRFTSNKERLFNKILQLECPVGAYTTKEVGGGQIAVPQEALALYITINPRSFIKATSAGLRKLLDLVLQPYNGFHPYQEVLSEVQKAQSRKEFVTFDFDMKKSDSEFLFTYLKANLPYEAYDVVETRGGYHLLVKPSLADKNSKMWYQNIALLLSQISDDKNNKGDIMLPVPGTYQGGFTPKFIY